MYNIRLTTVIQNYDVDRAVQTHLLREVGKFVRLAGALFELDPRANCGERTSLAQVYEFEVQYPVLATDLAEEVCRIAEAESIGITIDGRPFTCVGTREGTRGASISQ